MTENKINDQLFDKQLQNLLQGHQETPSGACWDKLACQLDKLASPVHTVPHAGKVLSSWIMKAVIPIVAVTGIAIGVVLLTKPAEKEDVADADTNIMLAPTDNNSSSIEKESVIIPQKTYSDETTVPQPSLLTENNESEATTDNNIAPSTAEMNSDEDIPVAKESVAEAASVSAPAQVSEKKPAENNNKEKTAVPPAIDTPKENEQPVAEPADLFIPNIITPNGDNYNDCLEIFGMENTSLNHIIIFTMQGKVIYSKENYKNDWFPDNLPDGVYYFYFKYIHQGVQFLRKGSITIKR